MPQTRFQHLKGELGRKGVRDPGALAAWIGRRKYGAKKFQQMGVAGKHGHHTYYKKAIHKRLAKKHG